MKNKPSCKEHVCWEMAVWREEKLPVGPTNGLCTCLWEHVQQQRQIDCAVSELRWSILMMGRETNSGKCSAGGATADWRVMNPHQLAHRRRSVITLLSRTLPCRVASPANSILDPAHPRCNLRARTPACCFMHAAFFARSTSLPCFPSKPLM